MTAVGIAFCIRVGGGGVQGGGSHGALDCLGLLLAIFLLPIIAFSIIKVRSFLNHSGKEKQEFTSLRSTGKTIVKAAPDDDEDPDQAGGVN